MTNIQHRHFRRTAPDRAQHACRESGRVHAAGPDPPDIIGVDPVTFEHNGGNTDPEQI